MRAKTAVASRLSPSRIFSFQPFGTLHHALERLAAVCGKQAATFRKPGKPYACSFNLILNLIKLMAVLFDDFMNLEGFTLLLFFSRYSPVVSRTERSLETFVKKHPRTARFLRVACSPSETEITSRYGIRSMPTVLGLRNGREVWRLEGPASEKALEALESSFL